MKNSLRRIFALALVVMMIASLGMSAFAADDDTTYAENVVTFTKTLTKEANAYAPNTTYTFTIASATADDGLNSANSIYAGPAGGVTFVDGDEEGENQTSTGTTLAIKSTPDATDLAHESLTYTGKIAITPSVFTKSGIYRYVVTESDCNYAGVDCDTDARYLDIYVKELITDGTASYVVEAAVMYKVSSGSTTNTETGAITYNDKGGFDNDYDTADLTVSKTVSGNLGETNKSFTFEITITGVSGEQYHVVLPTLDEDGKNVTATIYSGEKYEFTLTHGQEIKVYGLSVNDKYTVVENDYTTNDGYTTTVNVNNAEQATTANTTGEVTVNEVSKTTGEGEDAVTTDVDQSVVFTNNKQVTIPTGIAMTVLPFVAMIALAAIVAVLFFQKRERREA